MEPHQFVTIGYDEREQVEESEWDSTGKHFSPSTLTGYIIILLPVKLWKLV